MEKKLNENRATRNTRSTRAYLDEADKQIIKMLIEGYSLPAIIQYLLNEHNITESAARQWLRRCYGKLTKADERTMLELATQYEQMYLSVYESAIENNEYKTAKDIIDSLVKMKGLLTTKIEANVTTDFEIKFN